MSLYAKPRKRTGQRCLVATAVGAAMLAASGAMAQDPERVVTDAMVNQQGLGIRREAPRSATMFKAWGGDNRLVTPALNVAALRIEDTLDAGLRPGRPRRVGVGQEVEVSSDHSGRWTLLDDGGWLWTFAFEASGGHAIRLRVDRWHPTGGVEIRIFDPLDPTVAFGPIGPEYPAVAGELWTPIIFGPRLGLEYYLPPGIDHLEPRRQITVSRVVNFYELPAGAPAGQRGIPFGGPLPCHLDVSCFPSYQQEADGVGKFVVMDSSGNIAGGCTGSLLNRASGAQDSTPIFGTAAHCMASGTSTGGIVIWFDQTDGCLGVPPDPTTLPQTPVTTVLATNITVDHALLGLAMNGAVPAGATFLGWDNAYLDFLEDVHMIHHPVGSFKRITFGTKQLLDLGIRPDPAGGDICIPGNQYIVASQNGEGVTQPGSSGCPLLDIDGRVRGVLSCGFLLDCAFGFETSFARLQHGYPDLQPWLNPTDPIYVDSAGGGVENGEQFFPFDTIIEGVYAVIGGSEIRIEAGTYTLGTLTTIDKPMTIIATGGTVTLTVN